jgi:hypothetical protein
MPPIPMRTILDKLNDARTRSVSLFDAFVEVRKHAISTGAVVVGRLLRHLIEVVTWSSHIKLIEFLDRIIWRRLTDT